MDVERKAKKENGPRQGHIHVVAIDLVHVIDIVGGDQTHIAHGGVGHGIEIDLATKTVIVEEHTEESVGGNQIGHIAVGHVIEMDVERKAKKGNHPAQGHIHVIDIDLA
jgi:hypothetical protein